MPTHRQDGTLPRVTGGAVHGAALVVGGSLNHPRGSHHPAAQRHRHGPVKLRHKGPLQVIGKHHASCIVYDVGAPSVHWVRRSVTSKRDDTP